MVSENSGSKTVDGRVPVGAPRLRLEVPPRSRVVLGQHPSGHYSMLAGQLAPKTKPKTLFSHLPNSKPIP